MSWWWFLLPVVIVFVTATVRFGWKKMLPALLVVGFFAISWWGFSSLVAWWKSDDGDKKKTRTEERVEQHTSYEPVEALVLEKECITPCEVGIAWKAKIRGEGNPLRITFPGVGDPVSYPGEGDFKAPKHVRSGNTLIESANPKRPNVRVQIYRKIYIRR